LRLRAAPPQPLRAAPLSHQAWRLLHRAYMTALDRLIPMPRLVEVDHVDLDAPPDRVWELVRHGQLGNTPLTRALFALRSLPGRLGGQPPAKASFSVDDLVSSPASPGFQVLIDHPPREVAVGAIGKVWQGEIPFVHVDSVDAFASFAIADHARVAWSIRVVPRGEASSRVELEVRVDTTDEESWKKFRRYFRFIGIGSRFIRHTLLASLAKELGTPEAHENERTLPADELLPDAKIQHTRGITIAAPPEQIWPWLLQMGSGRGGFYSIDVFDNGVERSARELHHELTRLRVGDVVPASPESEDGFEVLRLDPPRCLVLGALYDPRMQRQLPFAAFRPEDFWHVTWSFVLEPLDADTTRLHVRARAAFSAGERLHAAWIRPVHQLMESAQLRHLAARVEARLPVDDWRDVLSGIGGAAIMAAAFFTGFSRNRRNHWGVDAEVAARRHPGDELVPEPRWSWTHGIEIAAPAEAVWPWVAQMGADRAGFYSYQWLENLAGCRLRNAETIHPEWQIEKGGLFKLHPKMPPLGVVDMERGRWFVAFGPPDEKAQREGKPWAAASWLFFVEPLDARRCRLISRYRCATSDDFTSRALFGPTLVEPVGFAMDRRMLLGVKERAERVVRPLRRLAASVAHNPR
jgi:hypothetical protein